MQDSELQEGLSGNFAEFGMWFLHKTLLLQYILGWKIVGSFIENSVAHEKRIAFHTKGQI